MLGEGTLHRRKLFLCAISYICGIAAAKEGMPIAAVSFAAVFLFFFSLRHEPESLNVNINLTVAILVSFALGAVWFTVDDMQISRGSVLDKAGSREYVMQVYDVRIDAPDQTKSGIGGSSKYGTGGSSQDEAEKDVEAWYSYRTGTKVRLRCEIESDEPGVPKKAKRILLTCYADRSESGGLTEYDEYYSLIGRRISVRTEISAPMTAGNPRCFDYALYLKSEGITHTATCSPGDIEILADTDRREGNRTGLPGPYTLYLIAKRKLVILREHFLDSLESDGSGRTESDSETEQAPQRADGGSAALERDTGLIRGILFGVTGELDESVEDSFRDNGLSHILAVSGMHIGILYALYMKIRKKNGHSWVTALFCMLLVIYGTVTLWSVSVRRAVFLVLITVLGKALDRRSDILTSLGATAVIILIVNPRALFGASFQMSFLAVLSISFFQAPFFKMLNKAVDRTGISLEDRTSLRGAFEAVSVVLAAQSGMLPYMAFTFNRVPLLALFIAFPAATLLSLMMPVGMISLALYAAVGRTLLFGKLLTMSAEVMIRASLIASAGGKFAVDVVSPPVCALILAYGAAFYLSSEYFITAYLRREIGTIFKCAALTIAAAGIAMACWISPFDKASIIMADVGQGDCIHVRSSRADILIDGGGRPDYNVGENVLKPYLLKNGAWNVDIAFATHLHTDHYKGLTELADSFRVKDMVTKAKTGDTFRIGKDITVTVIYPDAGAPVGEDFDENRNSIIYKVTVKGISILITGDIGAEGEELLCEKYKGTDVLKCDILKAAHHGSRFSTTDRFLDAAAPKAVVIGVGKNSYGHPSADVLEKLEKRGIPVFRTDTDGAIGIIRKDKDTILICTQRTEKKTVVSTYS